MSPIERSAGGGGASAGGLVQLFDSGYLGAPAASIDTGAAGIASGHFCLVIYGYLRSTSAILVDNVLMRVNNDSAANYDVNRIQNANTTLSGFVSSALTSILLGDIPAASAPANTFGPVVAHIPAYDGTANFKTGTAQSAGMMTPATDSIQNLQTYLWRSTSAISRLTFLPASNNFASGSRVVIYGTQ